MISQIHIAHLIILSLISALLLSSLQDGSRS